MMQARDVDWDEALRTGMYTIPEASRLIGAPQSRLRSWIEGNTGAKAGPIIERQLPRIGGRPVLGFLDLVEARFIRHFAAWLSPQTIRKTARKLRERHDVDHPFAMNKRFRTDGKAIFMESAETDAERNVLNLMNDNFEMEPVIEQSLFNNIFYVEDIARRWMPNPNLNLVMIDPMVCFGHPAISERWVPTEKIFDAYLVEGSIAVVAEDYGLSEDAVTQAVRFEQGLRERSIH